MMAIAQPEIVSAKQLFHVEEQQEKHTTWVLRLIGSALMFLGFALIARPLSVLVAFLPFLDDVVEVGVVLLAAALTVPLALSVIALAWIAQRPLLGGAHSLRALLHCLDCCGGCAGSVRLRPLRLQAADAQQG